MPTNEYERDLYGVGASPRPGRIDLNVFQNIPDVGDGYPGIQRCIRNWHKKDLYVLNERVYYITTLTQLNDAITDIEANAPCAGIMIILNSIYDVQLVLNSSTCSYTLQGNGEATVLTPLGTNDLITVTNAASVDIRNLKIDISSYTTQNHTAINVASTIRNVRIYNNHFVGGGIISDVGQCIKMAGDDSYISNNLFETVGRCVWITTDSTGVIMSNNNLMNIVRYGFFIEGDRHIISNNILYNCGTSASGVAIYLVNVDYIVICGNNLFDGKSGIYVAGNSNSITGNVICGFNGPGINLNNGDRCTISGNVCNDNTHGINLNATCGNSTVVGNTCLGNTVANYSNASGTTFDTDGAAQNLNNII